MRVSSLTTLVLSLGCSNKPAEQSPAGNEKPANSTSQQESADVVEEHNLVVGPVTPIPKGGEAPEMHVRYNVTVRHAGKLLVRVREALLVPDPPLTIRVPSFSSARRAPWADASGSLESDGLAQTVLDLSDVDFAAPLEIEVRVVDPREAEVMVGVDLWL